MEFAGYISLIDVVWLGGLIIFGSWLLKTSLGRKALADSIPRRNNMPFYLPFIPLFIWFGPVGVAAVIAEKLLDGLPQWQETFLLNLIYCIGGLAVTALIILLARVSFARRLKGFGLNAKTIIKDFLAGAANLLAVWPLVIAMILLTTSLGKLIWGQDFEMQQHQELELMTAHSQLPLRILIIVLAVVIAPVLEEMLFRGLFQTMLRGVIKNAWTAIILISALFAVLHPWTHWLALFALSMCLGYAYEKSGSLFRPIFIHSLFNGIAIIATLYQ
ncbi:MAG: lysostaphin resistance A-like protein [Planctomycetota bacterium]|jgi:membrane protease YdiL (CAAX protease family)